MQSETWLYIEVIITANDDSKNDHQPKLVYYIDTCRNESELKVMLLGLNICTTIINLEMSPGVQLEWIQCTYRDERLIPFKVVSLNAYNTYVFHHSCQSREELSNSIFGTDDSCYPLRMPAQGVSHTSLL